MNIKPKVLLIGGPTAVGKTALSFACAKLFDGQIISADCMQVYKALNIGSAKPTKQELQTIEHHLIDELEPTEGFDVDAFKKRAHEIILKLNAQKKLPIIVGGTGLYMLALLFPYNLGNAPRDENIRKKYQELAQQYGNEYIHNILMKVDKESAEKLHFNDTKRVIRALEIFEVSGVKKSKQTVTKQQSEYDFTLVVLNKDRKLLYDTINKRVDKMFEEGLLEEVEYLIKEKRLTKDLQSMAGIGYKEFFDYFEGNATKEEIKEKIKQNTRNYAKRQITWFKSMPEAHWFDTQEGIEEVLTFLKTKYAK